MKMHTCISVLTVVYNIDFMSFKKLLFGFFNGFLLKLWKYHITEVEEPSPPPAQNLSDLFNSLHCHLKIFVEFVANSEAKQMLLFLKSYQLLCASFGSKGTIYIT